MKIGIVGGGAVGLLMASYLTNKYDVTVYTRRESQANLLNKNGLRLIKEGAEQTIFIKSKPIDEIEAHEDIIIVAVKQYHLSKLIAKCSGLEKSDTIIFLQNGMGHINLLNQLTNRNILLGVVEHGALKHDDRTVEHTGKGQTCLAVWRGDFGNANRFINEPIPSFPFNRADDWYAMLARKLVVNAVVNPLTAILRVENGQLLAVSDYKRMMELLFKEVVAVLSLSDEVEAWEHVLRVCKKTASNRSSMLRDIEQGRKTEVEAILGSIIEMAMKKNVPAPLCQFLFYALKGMEQR